jgi:hypothetical protein
LVTLSHQSPHIRALVARYGLFELCQVLPMSMTNQEEFAARLARVQGGGAHTKGTIFVGQDEQHHMPRRAAQKQAKGKAVALNALYPLSLAGAFGLGLFGAALGIYARFQLMTGQETVIEDADLEMALSGVIGLMLAFVLAQIFRLTSKAHRGLQGVGVFVMICGFHNFAHWVPGPMVALFSPAYVADIQAKAPPNSAKFRGLYFPLFDQDSPAVALAAPTTEGDALAGCGPAEAAQAVTVLRTDNAQKTAKSGQKTVAAAPAGGSTCGSP